MKLERKGRPIEVAGEFLSAAQLDQLPRPKGGRNYWRDARTPGLYFVVSATGRRAFEISLESAGRWRTLGPYREGGMSLAAARAAFARARARNRAGLDPWPHPREAGLARLAPLLGKLRGIDVLREGQPGIFRWKSKAFLHFHYGHDRIEADVRITDSGWTRFDVSMRAGQQALLRAIRKRVGT